MAIFTDPSHHSEETAPSPFRNNVHFALFLFGLFVATSSFFFAFAQDGLWGDGAQILTTRVEAQRGWHHPGYLAFGMALEALFSQTPFEALSLTSAVGAGLLVTGAVWMACLFGMSLLAAIASALVLASTQGVWFHATTVEVHALHTGVFSMMLPIAFLGLRKRASARGSIFFCIGLLLTATHLTAPILFPGWCILAAFLPPRVSSLWKRIAPVAIGLTAGGCMAFLWSYWQGGLLTGGGTGIAQVTLGMISPTSFLLVVLQEIPFAWGGATIALLALFAPCLRETPWFWPATCWLLLSVLFFGLIGVPTYGGYLLSCLPILGVIIAQAWKSQVRKKVKSRFVAGLLLIAASQALWITTWRGGALANEMAAISLRRVERVAMSLPNGGVLISADPSLQTVNGRVPNVFEINIWQQLQQAWLATQSPEEFLVVIQQPLMLLLEEHPGDLVLERSWARPGVDLSAVEVYIESLEGMIRSICRYETVGSESGPDWRILGMKSQPHSETLQQ